MTEATADCGFALLMAAARRIPAADRWAKGPEFTAYTNMVSNACSQEQGCMTKRGGAGERKGLLKSRGA